VRISIAAIRNKPHLKNRVLDSRLKFKPLADRNKQEQKWQPQDDKANERKARPDNPSGSILHHRKTLISPRFGHFENESAVSVLVQAPLDDIENRNISRLILSPGEQAYSGQPTAYRSIAKLSILPDYSSEKLKKEARVGGTRNQYCWNSVAEEYFQQSNSPVIPLKISKNSTQLIRHTSGPAVSFIGRNNSNQNESLGKFRIGLPEDAESKTSIKAQWKGVLMQNSSNKVMETSRLVRETLQRPNVRARRNGLVMVLDGIQEGSVFNINYNSSPAKTISLRDCNNN